MVQLIRACAFAMAVVAAGACKKQENTRPAAPPPPVVATPADAAVVDAAPARRWYRARVRVPDGTEAIFFLGAPAGTGNATIATGSHHIDIPATFDGTRLEMPIPVHMTSLEATAADDGSLAGTFSMSWGAVDPATIELRATPVAAPTLAALATVPGDGAPIDLGASRTFFRLQMEEAGIVKLVVEQRAPGELEASLHFDTGNIIPLAGNGRGDRIVLTGFDGTGGYHVELALDGERATGSFAAGYRFDWRETFTATRRAEDFALAMKPKPARAGVKVRLPGELASLEGPMFVEIAGSWCSVCRDAAPFIGELHREYGPKGLQVVTLLYEFTDDPVADARQVELFKSTYNATWPVVAVTGDIEDLARTLPADLANVEPTSFPMALFVKRDGTLLDLHAGFPAASLEEETARIKREYRARIEQLLAK